MTSWIDSTAFISLWTLMLLHRSILQIHSNILYLISKLSHLTLWFVWICKVSRRQFLRGLLLAHLLQLLAHRLLDLLLHEVLDISLSCWVKTAEIAAVLVKWIFSFCAHALSCCVCSHRVAFVLFQPLAFVFDSNALLLQLLWLSSTLPWRVLPPAGSSSTVSALDRRSRFPGWNRAQIALQVWRLIIVQVYVNLLLRYTGWTFRRILLGALAGSRFHLGGLCFGILLGLRVLAGIRRICQTSCTWLWWFECCFGLRFECLWRLECLNLWGSLALAACGCSFLRLHDGLLLLLIGFFILLSGFDDGGLLIVDVFDVQVYLVAVESLSRFAALFCVLCATCSFACLLNMWWCQRQVWCLRDRDVYLTDVLSRILTQGIFGPLVAGNISTFLVSSSLADIWTLRCQFWVAMALCSERREHSKTTGTTSQRLLAWLAE